MEKKGCSREYSRSLSENQQTRDSVRDSKLSNSMTYTERRVMVKRRTSRARLKSKVNEQIDSVHDSKLNLCRPVVRYPI